MIYQLMVVIERQSRPEFLLGLMLMACLGTLIGLVLGYLGQGGLGYLAG
jgi:hypothetical protein